MTAKPKQMIRLTTQESIDLQAKAIELTVQTGTIIKESEIVHFLIKEGLKNVTVINNRIYLIVDTEKEIL